MSSQLQNGEQQFFDNNGKPLNGGTVDFYIPNTTTRKDTWQDQAQTILNTNPIVLDAGGRAVIWGTGSYRQVLKDNHSNLIWDKVVADSLTPLYPITGASIIGADDGASGTIFTTVAGFIAKIISSTGSSIVGFIQSGVGAVSRSVQSELRDVFKITQFGASIPASTTTNKAALQLAITACNAVGGGLVVVPGGVNYGYKRTDFTTFPDFTGVTTPILVLDYGVGNSYTSPTIDGSQVRRFFFTPNPAMSDGNGVVHRASWHPYMTLSSDNTGTRDISDPYRASIFFEANGGPIGWRWGQRDTNPGFTGTTIEQQTGLGLSVEGNYIWNAGTSSWNSTTATFIHGHSRYKGYWAWGANPEGLGRAFGYFIRKDVDNAVFSIKGETASQAPTLLLEAGGTGNNFQIAMTQTGSTRAIISVASAAAIQVDNGNHVHIGTQVPATSYHSINSAVAEGVKIAQVNSSLTTATTEFFSVASFGANAAACGMTVGRNSSTLRSINAGGTVNASGADYAEYMYKTPECADIAKGAICGINASGELTDKWADAIAFAVKSTAPSYVGGDTWAASLGPAPERPTYREPDCDEQTDDSTYQQQVDQAKTAYATELDEWQKARTAYTNSLEMLRQKVDRIAFAGQVPVNVINAIPGQFIIPTQDGEGIKGIAKNESDLSLPEYMRCVGKVISIEIDGRPRIIVKVS